MNDLKQIMDEVAVMTKKAFIESKGLPNEDELKVLKLVFAATNEMKKLCDDIEQLKLEVKQLKDEKQS